MKLRAQAQLEAAEATLGGAISAEATELAEDAKAKAVARVTELQAQLEAAKADRQAKLDSASANYARRTSRHRRSHPLATVSTVPTLSETYP